MTRLRRLRIDAGLSRAEACERLQVSGNYLSQLERGAVHPSDRLLRRLQRAFGRDLSWTDFTEQVE